MPEPISLLLVDDQKLLREGFHVLLDREEDLTVVGEAGDGEEAVDLYAALRPDVVLMDVQMPKMGGLAAIREIHGRDPQAKVIILTTFDDDEYVFEGMRAGALGYLLKSQSSHELAAAVRTAHMGGAPLEPMVARKVISALGPPDGYGGAEAAEATGAEEETAPESDEGERGGRGGEEADLAELLNNKQEADSRLAEGLRRQEQANAGLAEPLSRREREVLLLIGEGLSNRKIANRLNLAEGTVKNYVSSLIGKLNVQDRTQAALLSRELGLLT